MVWYFVETIVFPFDGVLALFYLAVFTVFLLWLSSFTTFPSDSDYQPPHPLIVLLSWGGNRHIFQFPAVSPEIDMQSCGEHPLLEGSLSIAILLTGARCYRRNDTVYTLLSNWYLWYSNTEKATQGSVYYR